MCQAGTTPSPGSSLLSQVQKFDPGSAFSGPPAHLAPKCLVECPETLDRVLYFPPPPGVLVPGSAYPGRQPCPYGPPYALGFNLIQANFNADGHCPGHSSCMRLGEKKEQTSHKHRQTRHHFTGNLCKLMRFLDWAGPIPAMQVHTFQQPQQMPQ